MTAIGLTLFWCMLQVTAVSFAAIVIYLFAAKGGATTRGRVALIGLLIAAALTPVAFAPWPRWESPSDSGTAATNRSPEVVEQAETPVDLASSRLETDAVGPWTSAADAFLTAVSSPPTTEEPSPRQTIAPRRPHWSLVAAWLFLAAAIAGLLRIAAGAYAVTRSVQRARPIYDAELFGLLDVLRAELSCTTPVEIRESSEIATAALAGWKRPVLLLPPDWRAWTEPERRAVLAHELAHAKRQGYLVTVASQAALAMHYYHPMIHWLAGRVRLEQELAADALAASVAGGRAAYLRCLAELALRRSDGQISWPAKAFLPSRRTFLRRIEMLRDPQRAVDRPAPLLRSITAGGLLLFGLLVAGVRPETAVGQPAEPVANVPPEENAVESGSNTETTQLASPVAYIPANAPVVAVIKPIQLLADPAVKPFVAEFDKMMAESQSPVFRILKDAGINPQTIETFALGSGDGLGKFAIRLSKAANREIFEKRADETKTTFGGVVYRFGTNVFVMLPDDRTVLMADHADTLTAMIISGQVNRASSPWTKVEQQLAGGAVTVMLDANTVSAELRQAATQRGPNTPAAAMAQLAMGTVLPLLQDVKQAGISLMLGEKLGVRGYAACDDESGARRVRETLEAVVTMGKNTLRQAKGQIASQPPEQQALAKVFVPIAEQLLDSAKVKNVGTDVTLSAESGVDARIALGLLMPALQQAREAARRAQSQNNLKQIGLAFHNYHDTYNHFPPAVIDENGVSRSWRVELLPFLDQKALYDQYRKDEPWDSEANKKVLAQMPTVFKDPSDTASPTSTSYFALVGPKPVPRGDGATSTFFSNKPIDLTSGGKGPTIRDVTDGTSNTILVVEAKRDVPWTKPEDIPFDPETIEDLVKNQLGGNHDGGFEATLADGSVHFISKTIDYATMKAMITPAGGEVISLP